MATIQQGQRRVQSNVRDKIIQGMNASVNDNFPGFDDAALMEGNNANVVYVNDQGGFFSQNSFVNLAMFY